MAAELKQVKESLDNTLLDFFSTLQSLYQLQAKLEQSMRGGFLSLSRARYTMGGPRNVGALQFAENELELEPVVEVHIENSEEDESLTTSSLDGKGDKDEKVNPDSTTAASTHDSGVHCAGKWVNMKLMDRRKTSLTQTEKAEEKEVSTVRQRNVKKKSADEIETVGKRELQTDSDKSKGKPEKPENLKEQLEDRKAESGTKIKDPLRLFGVLVSPHLRHSQASFEQAVKVSVEIANVKQKLCALRKEYAGLMAQKKTLESESRS